MLNVVSGVSRSGTSLMMECLRKTFGDDRIFGEKFPQENRIKYLDEPYPGESEAAFACRKYLRRDKEAEIRKDFEKSVDMNPNGFWESLYAVQGVYYRFGDRRNLDKWLSESHPTYAKIVCRGLWRSDPRYIGKIVYMLRHPRDVAKSQERLKRDLPVVTGDDGKEYRFEDELVFHTPRMFIDVTRAACAWLGEYDPDLHVVPYDDLIERPAETFTGLREFLGEGDFSEAVDSIDPKLRRSSDGKEVKHPLWGMAENVYELMLDKNYAGVLEALEGVDLDAEEKTRRWTCPRAGRLVFENECELCRSNAVVRSGYRKSAEQFGTDWMAEPCLYECGFGPGPHVSLEDSVLNNFWME